MLPIIKLSCPISQHCAYYCFAPTPRANFVCYNNGIMDRIIIYCGRQSQKVDEYSAASRPTRIDK